jgi:protein CLEC16A
VQVIQTLGILVGNTKSTQLIFYLLSNNHINDLIVHPFDFHHEELLSHYISFLKVLQ